MGYIHEDHQREQYFFAPDTLSALSAFCGTWAREHAGPVACLCCPMLARTLDADGIPYVALDVDERFADLAGFRRFDLSRPVPQPEEFSLIVCDPPFFTVSLSTVFRAIRMLTGGRFDVPLLISYLARRSSAVTGTFARFGVRATDVPVEYLTVQPVEKNRTVWLTNLHDTDLLGLR